MKQKHRFAGGSKSTCKVDRDDRRIKGAVNQLDIYSCDQREDEYILHFHSKLKAIPKNIVTRSKREPRRKIIVVILSIVLKTLISLSSVGVMAKTGLQCYHLRARVALGK
jgi:hypothetical protein